ncbi:MAG: hypothetical protein IJT94_17850, partial [Oscillibacter sp.]|nr:hypothetical protein [Oscillibacter sp.]
MLEKALFFVTEGNLPLPGGQRERRAKGVPETFPNPDASVPSGKIRRFAYNYFCRRADDILLS